MGDGLDVTRIPSQCDLIQAVLSDGQPHRMEEIHQRVGFCRLNSRIAELRSKRGLNIVCDKSGGTYSYRLVGALSEPEPRGEGLGPEAPRRTSGIPDGIPARVADRAPVGEVHHSSSGSDSAPDRFPVQLTLEGAA